MFFGFWRRGCGWIERERDDEDLNLDSVSGLSFFYGVGIIRSSIGFEFWNFSF